MEMALEEIFDDAKERKPTKASHDCIVLFSGGKAVTAPVHYLKKRDLLHNPKTLPAALSAAAREYMSLEVYSDAIDFFERAHDDDGLKEIKQLALDRGDTFLLNRLERIDPKWVTPDDWEKARKAAEKREIFSMAAFAERKLKPPEETQEPAAPGTQPLEEAAAQDGQE